MNRIDKTKCIGCKICVNRCPDGYQMVNGKAEFKNENAPCLEDGAKACPKHAIILDGLDLDQNPYNEHYPRHDGSGQGRGMGRGTGRRQGRGIGHGMGKGQGQGRGEGRGRGR